MNIKKRLGRIIKPDERDKGFLLKSVIPEIETDRTYKYWWPSGWWGDQGDTPQCVAYSWAHWLAAGPITQKKSRSGGRAPYDPNSLYHEAQKLDYWEGEDYDGTSVRAGAKALVNHGFVSEYRWTWDIDTMTDAVLKVGPVVVGTWWLSDMIHPDSKGKIKASGDKVGGHAYLIDGVNTDKELFRIKNSWGRQWGKNGFAYISFDDMNYLISDDGEVCMAKEIDKVS